MRTASADSAVPVGPAPVFEEFELVMKKRVEPTKEVAPVLKKKMSTLQSSTTDKGKGIKPNVSRKKKKKKKFVPLMRLREIVIGSSTTSGIPICIRIRRGSNFQDDDYNPLSVGVPTIDLTEEEELALANKASVDTSMEVFSPFSYSLLFIM